MNFHQNKNIEPNLREPDEDRESDALSAHGDAMMTQTTSAAIAIASVVMYQVCMKIVPQDLNPISALATIFGTALICTLIAARFAPVDPPSWSFAEFSWAPVLVGVAIVGIELGYLLMYRGGWRLEVAPLVVMGSAAVILTPIGLLAFRQSWSSRSLFGIALCLYGLYLLSPQEQ